MYEIIQDLSNVGTYSYSKLSSFHQCKYGFDLNYNKKVRGKGNSMAAVGSLVHDILERYFKGELYQFELASEFEKQFEVKVPHGVSIVFANGFKHDMTQKYKDQCMKFLEEFDEIEGVKVLDSEKKFSLLVKLCDKTAILTGIVDIVAEDVDGNIIVIDWKSKSAFKNKAEVQDYAKQLYTYALYIQDKYGKFPTELWFYQFRINHIEKIKFDIKDFEKVMEWVDSTIQSIECETEFVPIDFTQYKTKKEKDDVTFFCRCLCNYRDECFYYL